LHLFGVSQRSMNSMIKCFEVLQTIGSYSPSTPGDLLFTIPSRLELAGAIEKENPILKEVIETIYSLSEEMPRLVSTLCEDCAM
jgi:hypothetical protein